MSSTATSVQPRPIKGWLAVHYSIATWFGCGFAPFAPGTFGALGAVPLVLLLQFVNCWSLALAVLVAVSISGARSAHVVAVHRQDDDPSLVVVDEVAGVLTAWLCVSHCSIGIQVLAWVLFRVFDITKPGPIATLEHTRPIGVGIMLDDLLAGLVAGLLALVVHLGVAFWF